VYFTYKHSFECFILNERSNESQFTLGEYENIQNNNKNENDPIKFILLDG